MKLSKHNIFCIVCLGVMLIILALNMYFIYAKCVIHNEIINTQQEIINEYEKILNPKQDIPPAYFKFSSPDIRI